MTIRSAVAVLETATTFVLQRRPDLPGRLAYPGKVQLLGGHALSGEALEIALRRELGKETDLDDKDIHRIEPLWEGSYRGEDPKGEPIDRYVGVFRVRVGEAPGLLEPGELVEISQEPEAVEEWRSELTPFAYRALRCVMGEETWD